MNGKFSSGNLQLFHVLTQKLCYPAEVYQHDHRVFQSDLSPHDHGLIQSCHTSSATV